MDTSTLTIIIAGVFTICVFLLIKISKYFASGKNSKLSYNDRVFLQANLDLELNNENLTDRYVRAAGREKKKDFKGAIDDINVIQNMMLKI
ncbi:MAG TPA: hypothetical protein PKE38_01130 [Ignavibacteriaceae bacterium]|nr:hypothetical protein [Ignavibacteriaceae bacterium]